MAVPLLDELAALVSCESPSGDPAATTACAQVAAQIGTAMLGRPPEELQAGGRSHLRWRFGSRCRVLLLGHLDTVWPAGTLARWPVSRADGRLSGPGVFDMKAGVVQGLYALAALGAPAGTGLLLTTDEELGSPSSRALIERVAGRCSAVLVLEAAAGGALKVGRKGVSIYRLEVHGRAAHAGLEPERGVNALLELAGQVRALADLADTAAGTTVTPTVASAGTTTNTVPAHAEVRVDVRVTTRAEQDRVDAAVRALAPALPGARLTVHGGPNRPPMEPAQARVLMDAAVRVAGELGLALPAEGVSVGGASDGNFTAGIGVPTLDGLGAVGDHAHAEGEYVLVDAMPERAALVAGLVAHLLALPPVPSRRD
jgi:glutamate carboxypeptidase